MSEQGQPLVVFYDGQCVFCHGTMQRLMRQDKTGKLLPVDIAAPEFDRQAWQLDERTDLMGRMHARLPDGRLVAGMESLRQIETMLGRGWRLGWTRWPLVSPLCDWAYRVFAKNRYKLAGRREPCASGRCKI